MRWKMRGFKRGLRQQNNGKGDAEGVKVRQGKERQAEGVGTEELTKMKYG